MIERLGPGDNLLRDGARVINALADEVERLDRLRVTPPLRLDDYGPSGRVLQLSAAAPAGGGSAAAAEYKGYFLLVKVSAGRYRIVDGAALAAGVAGVTDAGNVGELEVSAGNGDYIYLVISYNTSTAAYVHTLTINPPVGAASLLLGAIDSTGKLVQIWTGGAIYWQTRYLI